MTREEAIKRFETLLLHVDTDCVMGMETTEAINMAIKALEQPEPCKDAVSRQAVIEMIDTMASFFDPYGEEMISKYGVKIRLDFLKSIRSECKTGRWLTSDDLYETGICSCCKQDSQEPVSYAVTNFHYCPNCGADMRKDGEEDE